TFGSHPKLVAAKTRLQVPDQEVKRSGLELAEIFSSQLAASAGAATVEALVARTVPYHYHSTIIARWGVGLRIKGNQLCLVFVMKVLSRGGRFDDFVGGLLEKCCL